MRVRLLRLRFYPRLQYSSYIIGARLEGSTDNGVTFRVIGDIGKPHEGWNSIDVYESEVKNWFTHFRYAEISSPNYYCELAEIEIMGVLASASDSCAINVTANALAKSVSVGTVSYNGLQNTPLIRSVTPNNGTSLGGTRVTLHGLNLSPTIPLSTPSVYFSGVSCFIVYFNDSTIICDTERRNPSQIENSQINVLVPGRGAALVDDDAEYLYIDKWSALTSWLNQEPPLEGDLVWIPDGQVLLLDVNI
jgi:hypothetical protein